MTEYDDHYIPNSLNAHIDTGQFTNELTRNLDPEVIDTYARIENIYWRSFSWTSVKPEQPSDDALICRYLSPKKFLKFVSDREIYFPTSTMFADPLECTFHPDYDDAIKQVLTSYEINDFDWTQFVNLKKAEWNVSCWTLLDSYYDDHLLWSAYSEGSAGVGITIRYGTLRKYLEDVVSTLDVDGQLQCGRVSYSDLKILPFNKHPIFRSENEIRFAFRHFAPGPKGIDMTFIRNEFGLRVSPTASTQDFNSVRKIWRKLIGNERIQWPGRT